MAFVRLWLSIRANKFTKAMLEATMHHKCMRTRYITRNVYRNTRGTLTKDINYYA